MGLFDEMQFVEVDESGHALTAQDERMRRSHIRKTISRSKQAQPLSNRLRFVHQSGLPGKKGSRKRKVSLSASCSAMPRSRIPASPNVGDVAHPSTPVSNEASEVATQSPSRALTTPHPFAVFASRHVNLPLPRLGEVFKSDAFRAASEPLFDSGHVDSELNMNAVFPNCINESVFFHAVVYATVQTTNGGLSSTESLLLHGKTIQLLNEKLDRSNPSLSPAIVGAIMILKSVACKFPDLDAHDAHTSGLMKAVSLCAKNDIIITPAMRRAMFWLDLLATMLIHRRRQLSHTSLPPLGCWQREEGPHPVLSLPTGFFRHRSVLPDELLECISDTFELQSLVRDEAISTLPHQAKYHRLDTMQASIESRLAFWERSCQSAGTVAEAVRLAVFVVCYCSWMETWNSALIPCRLAERLVDMLEHCAVSASGQIHATWVDRLDLLLWILFVVSSVTQMGRGHVGDLQRRVTSLLQSIRSAICTSFVINPTENSIQQNPLNGFLCCDKWKEQRNRAEGWHELELAVTSIVAPRDELLFC